VHFKVGNERAVGPSNNVWCYDIRFDPKVIAEMFPPPPKAVTEIDALIAQYGYPLAGSGKAKPIPLPPPMVAAKHAGGAPAKVNWELVMAEIAARLYSGDLKPEKQAHIEEAITEIVMSLGATIGEATARRHANPLWEKIKSGS
jgi:hypothetical protein